MRAAVLFAMMLATVACTPYEAEPNSPVQWQRRQEAIERREAERQAYCAQPARAADATCKARPGVQP